MLELQTLYNFGAKKFGIIGVLPIGCCPAQRRYNATRGCQERLNDFARAFHFALDTLMRKISTELPEMKYSLGNTLNAEATSQLAAVTLYDGPPRFVTPINFRQLAKDN
ncbi:unnamed protein product [Camellia sinensis]